MIEKGVVKEVKGNILIVAPEKGAACTGCMNMRCKSDGGVVSAENPKSLPVKTGQMVELEISGTGLLAQALTAFLPLVAGFAAGYVIIRLLFPEAGEGPAAGSGIVLFLAAAFVVYRLRRNKKTEAGCIVTRIIE